MTKREVLVCDDDQRRATQWKTKLEEKAGLPPTFGVRSLNNEELNAAVRELSERRAALRSGSDSTAPGDALFDSASVLVIDYDLFELDPDGVLTGETVAYLARCYSTCGAIVGVNQFGENAFDLRLTGHPKSFADVNIGGAQVANPGLWTALWEDFTGWTGFRPWLWPSVPKLVRDFEKRVKDVDGTGLGIDVYTLLGLGEDVVSLLPSATREYWLGSGSSERPTLADIVQSSGVGLKRGDAPWEPALARIAAARLSSWLEQLVLPAQDILIDAPHLVSRFPSLADSPDSPDSLNLTTTLDSAGPGGFRSRDVASARYEATHWVSRPVWFWPQCARSAQIDEVRDPFAERKRLAGVFCEDVSRFIVRGEAVEYAATPGATFSRRFVLGPSSRIPGFSALKRVEYVPAGRLVGQ
jgi:hypothetical protein